jgi:hypothetical protein
VGADADELGSSEVGGRPVEQLSALHALAGPCHRIDLLVVAGIGVGPGSSRIIFRDQTIEHCFLFDGCD